jgi:hypothetical protein
LSALFIRAFCNVSWLEKQLAAIFLEGLPPRGCEEGEKEFHAAIEIAADVLRRHFELGLLSVGCDRPEKALQAFSKAAELPPLMASGCSRVGRARAWVTKLQKGS